MVTPSETLRLGKLSLGTMEAEHVARCTGIEIPAEGSKRTGLQHRLAKTWGYAAAPEWHIGQGRCKVCNTRFCEPGEDMATLCWGAHDARESIQLPTPVCARCGPLVSDHYGDPSAGREAIIPAPVTLTPKWDEKCPPKTAEIILSGKLPPVVDQVAFAQVQQWSPSQSKGLFMLGPTGMGKTLSFWALARKLEREGTDPVVLGSLEFNRVLQTAARDITDVEWLCRARVLMVDDFGKEKPSPGAAALLWEVLDRRYGAGLPFITTSRFSGSELTARFTDASLGEDIRRRLNKLCTPINFAGPNG